MTTPADVPVEGPVTELPPTWWVWFDRMLDEWFYSDRSPDVDPALALQLAKEKTVIHQVQADTGAKAVELVCPGYRDDRRADPVSAPPRSLPPRIH